MIVRILTEGQFDVPDDAVDELNVLDERLEAAINAEDEQAFTSALHDLLERVRSVGTEVGADELVESSLVLPFSDATLEEVRELLSDDGLIPGRSSAATS
ncbi:MAG: PspA-associated protein PspAA [Nocardioidaceae bacterium]